MVFEMKVFDIINETNLNENPISGLPGWSIARDPDNMWVARDADGQERARGRIRGSVEGDARRVAANAPASSRQSGQSDGDTNADSTNRKQIPDGGNLPEAEKRSLYKKVKDFLKAGGKATLGKAGGTLTAVVLNALNIKDDFDMLIDQYVQSGCNRDRYVRHAEQTIRISLVEAVRDILAGALGGVAAVAAALAIVPGLGWLASFAVGVLGGLVGMVMAKMATNDELVNNIAAWIGDNLFLRDLTGLIDVMDDVLENFGYDIVSCRESAQADPSKFLILEVKDDVIYESASTSDMRKMGLAMKQAVVKDPEIRKEYKKLKQQEQESN